MVCAGGLSVCKQCSEYEAGLDNPCLGNKCNECGEAVTEENCGTIMATDKNCVTWCVRCLGRLRNCNAEPQAEPWQWWVTDEVGGEG